MEQGGGATASPPFPMKLEHDAWFYRGQTARLFYAGQEIPDGWRDAPSDFNGADPAKFDHDGDGEPGGSVPKRRGRPPKQRPVE